MRERGLPAAMRKILAFLRCPIRRMRAAVVFFQKENAFLRAELRRQANELELCAAAHRKSELSFRLLADQLTELVWTMLPDGRVESFNRHWYSYTGLKDPDPKHKGWQIILHPDDLQRFFASWVMAYAAGFPYRAEFRLKPTDSDVYRWCSVYVFPQRDSTGKIERWIGVGFTGDEFVGDEFLGDVDPFS